MTQASNQWLVLYNTYFIFTVLFARLVHNMRLSFIGIIQETAH